MKHKWALTPLGEFLTERNEQPLVDDLDSGLVRIVEKISFGTGLIQLRSDGRTRTGMILIRPGDLVVSGINAAKGAIAIYDENSSTPAAATIHYGAYIPNKERVRLRFLWWMLRSSVFRELLLEHVPGGIKTELKAKRFLKIPVPLPAIDIQQNVVERIEEVASKIQDAKRIRTESLLQTKIAVESGIEDVMHRLTVSGKLEEVVTFKPRSGPSFVTSPDWTGTPVLMVSALSGFGLNTHKVEYGIGTEKISPKDRLEAGDILIARGNKREQVGNAGVVPDLCKGWVCANLVMRMRINDQLADPNFLIYWLRSPTMRRHVGARMLGTSPNIQKINQRTILSFPFPTTLPLVEQQRIVAELDELQAEVDALKRVQTETAAEIDALLPSVLDRAFKGELSP